MNERAHVNADVRLRKSLEHWQEEAKIHESHYRIVVQENDKLRAENERLRRRLGDAIEPRILE